MPVNTGPDSTPLRYSRPCLVANGRKAAKRPFAAGGSGMVYKGTFKKQYRVAAKVIFSSLVGGDFTEFFAEEPQKSASSSEPQEHQVTALRQRL